MPDVPSANRSSPLFVAAVLIVALSGSLLEYPNRVAVFGPNRVYFDGPDDYMRTWRARQIADGSAARIRHIAEINFPAGAELHWTAPMDYLLAGAGLAFGVFVTVHADPFGCVAAWLPLGLGVMYVIYMMAVMKRGFGWQTAVLVGLMVVLSPSWHRVFRIGHPDHHCLIALLLLFAVGAWIPGARGDGLPGEPRRWAGFVSGLAMGAAIWVSVESMVFWAAMVVALWGACRFGPSDERRSYARARLAWNCGVILVLATAHLIENWPDVGAIAADKVSLLYVILGAIGFLVPGGEVLSTSSSATGGRRYEGCGSAERGERRSQSQVGRYIAMLAGLAAFTVFLALRQSRAFEHVSRPEFTRWINNLMEFQPLYVHAGSHWSFWPLRSLMGYLPYALPVLLVFFLRCRQAPRAAKYALALLAPTIIALAVFQLRWIDHFGLAVVPVAVIGSCELVRTIGGGFRRARADAAEGPEVNASDAVTLHGLLPVAFVSTLLLLALLTFPAVSTVVTYGVDEAVQTTTGLRRTDFVAWQILAYESKHPEADRRRAAILSEDGEGPALLYWTGMPVVATPYHRALDGLMETAKFFAEHDPAKAREQLDRLGVRYVVMPPRAHEQLMQFEKMAFGELRSFDPPTESVGEFGGLMLKLNYRPREVAQTMAYRLVMEPEGRVIPGVERIAEINEGAGTPDGRPMKTGLLYVVHDQASASQAASQAAPE